MNFLNQLTSAVYLILITLFHSKAEKHFIDSQFSHSSGIYFEPISKVRVFSEKYHFISYIDIFQPDVLKYKIIDFSHKLYEYCTLSNIANNCNLYDKYLIFIMTIPIPSAEEFQLFCHVSMTVILYIIII